VRRRWIRITPGDAGSHRRSATARSGASAAYLLNEADIAPCARDSAALRPFLSAGTEEALSLPKLGVHLISRAVRPLSAALGLHDILATKISHSWRTGMNFTIELKQEMDGRWIAEIPELRGALVYGRTRQEAIAKGQALALRVLAEQLEQNEASSDLVHVTFNAA
jgi:predicted RNase H-like HicB family nuclease